MKSARESTPIQGTQRGQDTCLPIFAYGSLRGEGMYSTTGNRTLTLGRFIVRGVSVGMGDKYPCADVTYDMNDIALGDGMELQDGSEEALTRIDEYEGVSEGYYQRRVVFASPEETPGLFVPMWIYTRGERLSP